MPMASSMKQIFKKRQSKLPDQLQLRFIKRLHRLLNNGYPLLEALEVIMWDKELEKLASRFILSLKEGKPLDEVFEENKFHPTIYSFLYFIRANSNLSESMQRCIEMFEQRSKNTQKFKQILRYPLILLFIFSITIYFINQQVLPAFHSLLQSSTEAQQTIMLFIFIMDLLQFILIIIAIGGITCLLGWRYLKKRIPMDKQLKLLNQLPIYRRFIRLQTSFQFATHFSSLLKAGLSLKQILHELTKQQRLPIINFYADLLTNDLNRGFHLNALLSELPFIEKQLANIFQKNSDISALEKDLNLYSEILMEEIQRKIISAITFIQPIFYVFLAIFIVLIYVSLMWPMFQLIHSI